MENQLSSLRKSLVRFADLLGEALERDPELLAAFADLAQEIRGGARGAEEIIEESSFDERAAEEQKIAPEESPPSPDPATADQLADFVETFPSLASLSLAAAENAAPRPLRSGRQTSRETAQRLRSEPPRRRDRRPSLRRLPVGAGVGRVVPNPPPMWPDDVQTAH